MSLILRHRPESIGISLGEHGWANVDELLSGIGEQHPIDMDMLEENLLHVGLEIIKAYM